MDVDELKQKLVYEPDTGIFRWVNPPIKGPAKSGDRAGSVRPDGYRRITINQKHYLSHRLAFLWMTGKLPDLIVDHINGVPGDDRWENLREVTQSENLQNTRLNNVGPSGYRGVSKHHTGKWYARININKVSKFLGIFNTPEEANEARLLAEKQYWTPL